MTRRTSARRRLRSSGLAVLAAAALPLALTASTVDATTTVSAPESPAGSSMSDIAAQLDTVLRTRTAQAVPASYQPLARPALGDLHAGDIPWVALQAYQRAADILGQVDGSCALPWTLLAAVGQVESAHGLTGGARLTPAGVARPSILGPVLDGSRGHAAIDDTDGGTVDGDATWDRAVGPMQLLPGTWALAAVDGDGDGTRSPHDIDDAALAAGVVLCASSGGLDRTANARDALMAYNHSREYVEQVLAVKARYDRRGFAVSAAPRPASIGALLDEGPGRAARKQTEHALRALAKKRAGDAALAARRPTRPVHPAVTRDTAAKDPAAAPVTATEPTVPSEPTVPTEPTAPAEATEPSVPAQPAGPTEPDPATPTETPGTTGPTDPAQPAEPTDSTGPAESPEDPGDTPPSDDPVADPDPGDAEPATVTVSGALVRCDDSWCLDVGDGTPALLLDLGSADAEMPARLEGETVELVVLEGTEPMVVMLVNGVPLLPE